MNYTLVHIIIATMVERMYDRAQALEYLLHLLNHNEVTVAEHNEIASTIAHW